MGPLFRSLLIWNTGRAVFPSTGEFFFCVQYTRFLCLYKHHLVFYIMYGTMGDLEGLCLTMILS
jgi:hypothetical protein